MREELGRYCREVLKAAIAELEKDDLARYQLEVELVEIKEIIDELKSVIGNLLLAR
jgi:hypothetical protein